MARDLGDQPAVVAITFDANRNRAARKFLLGLLLLVPTPSLAHHKRIGEHVSAIPEPYPFEHYLLAVLVPAGPRQRDVEIENAVRIRGLEVERFSRAVRRPAALPNV